MAARGKQGVAVTVVVVEKKSVAGNYGEHGLQKRYCNSQGRPGQKEILETSRGHKPPSPPPEMQQWEGARRFKGKCVGVCVSGGLDSKTVCKRLVEEGINVLAFSADLGQPDESDINNVKRRMAACGVETVIVDLKDDMAEGCFDIIQAQARYDGGYWNTTGIGRYVTCRGLIGAMQEANVDVLAHGATGRGNDQMRFERYTNVLAPKMAVFAPWRDAELLEQFPGRTEMAAYLNKFGIEAFVGPKKKYSTDANLAGLSHEAEDLESVETSMLIVDPEMGSWPAAAPDKLEEVKLTFEKARCIAINGNKMTPQQAIRKANAIGGRHGIGISHALENRIIGTKSRGVYEAPGMEVSMRSHLSAGAFGQPFHEARTQTLLATGVTRPSHFGSCRFSVTRDRSELHLSGCPGSARHRPFQALIAGGRRSNLRWSLFRPHDARCPGRY